MLFGFSRAPISLLGLRVLFPIIGSWVRVFVWPGPGLSWDGKVHLGSPLEISVVIAIVNLEHVYACAPASTSSMFVGLCLIRLLMCITSLLPAVSCRRVLRVSGFLVCSVGRRVRVPVTLVGCVICMVSSPCLLPLIGVRIAVSSCSLACVAPSRFFVVVLLTGLGHLYQFSWLEDRFHVASVVFRSVRFGPFP